MPKRKWRKRKAVVHRVKADGSVEHEEVRGAAAIERALEEATPHVARRTQDWQDRFPRTPKR